MLYATPDLTPAQTARLREIDALRAQLGRDVARARPWVGTLRRQARAATARSSVAIEGFDVSPAAALEIVERGDASEDPDRRALAGYALAMDHVAVLASDPRFAWSDRVILDLHFEACSSDLRANPGRCRASGVVVTAPGGGVAYRAPAAADSERLFDEALRWLATGDLDRPALVRAAMAHLHLVSIHPFQDGNGRISRIIQSLVLARDGVLAPELGSIEEVLARNTGAYYAALEAVQGGSWQPERDASPWISFCLEAHHAQVQQRAETVREAARRWGALEALVAARGWPDRLVIALERSMTVGLDRASYAAEAEISPATASGDLRRLLDAGLVVRTGRTHNARYHASDALR